MKKVIGSMVVMFLLICWPLGGLWGMIFMPIIGGGVEQSFLYPIYGGLIILTGIIVGCAVILYDEIKKLVEKLENQSEKAKPKGKD